MNKKTATGALLAAFSVILGAFAAHGLQKYLDNGLMDEKMMHNFETAARYQMYHAIGIILLGILETNKTAGKWLNSAFYLFIAGVILFSGSLYVLSTRNVIGLENWQWLGPVTPLGGLCMISGWLVMAYAALKKKG
ncbi:MAG: DUF423 domain-containing protein [Bacteroidia bacterium]